MIRDNVWIGRSATSAINARRYSRARMRVAGDDEVQQRIPKHGGASMVSLHTWTSYAGCIVTKQICDIIRS